MSAVKRRFSTLRSLRVSPASRGIESPQLPYWNNVRRARTTVGSGAATRRRNSISDMHPGSRVVVSGAGEIASMAGDMRSVRSTGSAPGRGPPGSMGRFS
eukprot:4536565-Prymnesium_polylepis.1